MKVAVLTPSWAPVVGGVARFASSLVRELRHKDIGVIVLSQTGDAGPGVRIESGGRREFVRAAQQTLEAERPDVVHCHSSWYILRSAVRYRRKYPHTRLVFTFHTDWDRFGVLRRLVLERLLSRCDFLTFVSWSQATRLAARFRLRTPLLVVPPGGDTEQAPETPPDSGALEAIRDFRPLVVFLGPLSYPSKVRGVAALVEAWQLVLRRHPDGLLVIAGDGPLRSSLEQRAESRGIGHGFRFLGSVSSTRGLLELCDVYAHCSFQDSMPLAVLEAMFLGRPIVATRTGGIPEALANGECGILVDGAPEEIAAAIDRLIADPALASELGSRAQARAREHYRWARTAADFASVYGVAGRSRIHVSVDVEADFPRRPGSITYRGVEEGLPRIVKLLQKYRVPASFFLTLGCLERFPALARELASEGFSVGSHGEHGSRPFSGQPMEQQMRILERTAALIRQQTGTKPVGFRAPNFEANKSTFWALAASEYSVDSSLLPGRHVRRWKLFPRVDHRGVPVVPFRFVVTPPQSTGGREIVEVPVSPNPLSWGGPVGLGFLHAQGLDSTLRAINASPGRRAIFLVHPWEAIDAEALRRGPPWVASACSSDLAPLDDLLGRLSREGRFVSLEDEIRFAIGHGGVIGPRR